MHGLEHLSSAYLNILKAEVVVFVSRANRKFCKIRCSSYSEPLEVHIPFIVNFVWEHGYMYSITDVCLAACVCHCACILNDPSAWSKLSLIIA